MLNKTTKVKLFIMPKYFPCGPEATCCGPIGQSDEEIQNLKSAIGKETGSEVEVHNVTNENDMKSHPQIAQLFNSMGMKALPIVTLNEEAVSVGNPAPEQALSAIREKVNQL